ncbi:MAG: hypothetical protein D6702_01790 [Planctomycetota bacterium]|nr:MAG: hypothetical protein D6702_01790 [Planctomycetota bacterium]
MTNDGNQVGPRFRLAALIRRWTATAESFQAATAFLILAAGLAVDLFLGSRLGDARSEIGRLEGNVSQLEEATELMAAVERYRPFLEEEADPVSWQEFIQQQLEESGARLQSTTPGQAVSSGNFQILDLGVRAAGSFLQLTDFLRRLETCGRLIRVDDFALSQEEEVLVLDCKVRIMTGTSTLDLIEDGTAEEVEP